MSSGQTIPGIYWLGDAHRHTAFYGRVGVENLDTLWKLKRSESGASVTINHLQGSHLFDFIWVSGAAIISDRVVQLLHANSVTGWSLFNVSVFDAGEQPIAGYQGLAVTGRCARVGFDKRDSALIKKIAPNGSETSYFSGLKFPAESWDESDIFVGADLTIGGAWTLATQKVADLFRKETISNCLLTPIHEVDLLTQPSAIIRTQTAN